MDDVRVKKLEKFLKSLEDRDNTFSLMMDRMDSSSRHVMQEYAKLINEKVDCFQEVDKITASLMVGYLLKSHVDRLDIEDRFGE